MPKVKSIGRSSLGVNMGKNEWGCINTFWAVFGCLARPDQLTHLHGFSQELVFGSRRDDSSAKGAPFSMPRLEHSLTYMVRSGSRVFYACRSNLFSWLTMASQCIADPCFAAWSQQSLAVHDPCGISCPSRSSLELLIPLCSQERAFHNGLG